MTEFAVRFREKYIDILRFNEFLDKLFSEGAGYFFVKESGSVEDNVHYQGIIKTDIKQDALRKRIQKVITKKGNDSYSFKLVREPERYRTYLMKGPNNIELPEIYRRNLIDFSKEKIKEMHHKYWYEKEHTKDKTKCMIDHLHDKLSQYENGDTTSEVVKEIIHYYIVNKKPMNMFHMKSQARLLCCMLSEDYKTVVFNEIMRDL